MMTRRVANLVALAVALCALPTRALGVEPGHAEGDPEQVVVLHGLARDAGSMRPLVEFLTSAGYRVSNFDYDSRGRTPSDLVGDLASWVAECCESSTAPLHFVTHSLGGILVRAYLADHHPPNLARVVLLAPPNRGSELVDSMGDSAAFGALLGPTAVELGTGEGSLPNRLGPPDYEVGVIAGRQSVNPIASLLLPGPDDGAVTIESAKLVGAADFIVIDATHTFIMRNAQAHQQVLHFLRNGHFDRGVE